MPSGKKFSITAVNSSFAAVSFQVKYGVSGMAAADATSDMFPPGKYTMQAPGQNGWNYIRVFNPTAGTIDVYVSQLRN